jgi:hypothetical protein
LNSSFIRDAVLNAYSRALRWYAQGQRKDPLSHMAPLNNPEIHNAQLIKQIVKMDQYYLRILCGGGDK